MAGARSGAGTLGFVVLVVLLFMRGRPFIGLFIVLDIVSQVQFIDRVNSQTNSGCEEKDLLGSTTLSLS